MYSRIKITCEHNKINYISENKPELLKLMMSYMNIRINLFWLVRFHLNPELQITLILNSYINLKLNVNYIHTRTYITWAILALYLCSDYLLLEIYSLTLCYRCILVINLPTTHLTFSGEKILFHCDRVQANNKFLASNQIKKTMYCRDTKRNHSPPQS